MVVTKTVITHVAALTSVGRVHVTTWPAKPHEPAGDVTFVTVNCAGTVSETRERRRIRRTAVRHGQRVGERLSGDHGVGRVRLGDRQVGRPDHGVGVRRGVVRQVGVDDGPDRDVGGVHDGRRRVSRRHGERQLVGPGRARGDRRGRGAREDAGRDRAVGLGLRPHRARGDGVGEPHARRLRRGPVVRDRDRVRRRRPGGHRRRAVGLRQHQVGVRRHRVAVVRGVVRERGIVRRRRAHRRRVDVRAAGRRGLDRHVHGDHPRRGARTPSTGGCTSRRCRRCRTSRSATSRSSPCTATAPCPTRSVRSRSTDRRC